MADFRDHNNSQKNNKNTWFRNPVLHIVIAAMISALAFGVTFDSLDVVEPDTTSSLLLKSYRYLSFISADLLDKSLLLTVIFIGALLAYRTLYLRMQGSYAPHSRWMAGLFAILYTGSRGFEVNNTLRILISPIFNVLRAAILAVGAYCMFLAAINGLWILIHRDGGKGDANQMVNVDKDKDKNRDKAGLKFWVFILLCWLPHIILRFPGIMGCDNWSELSYFYGFSDFTTAQPVFHTWLIGNLTKLATDIWGYAGAGLFIFVLIQYLTGSAILAYSLLMMRKWNTPKWLMITTAIVYVVAPYYTAYVSFPIKDVLYAYMILWIIMFMMNINNTPVKNWAMSALQWIVPSTVLILVRKNGLYVYTGTVVCMLVYYVMSLRRSIINDKGVKKKNYAPVIALLLCTCIIPVLCSSVIENTIISKYNVQQDSIKEAFSLPLQQTARLVRDHGEELSQADIEAIDGVVPYDLLAEKYDELSADPVKTQFRYDAGSAVGPYLSSWFINFFKHPVTYIAATWNQFYLLFMPDRSLSVYNVNAYIGVDVVDLGIQDVVHMEIPGPLKGWSDICLRIYEIIDGLPVIGMLNCVGVYIFLMFVICVWLMNAGIGIKKLLVLVPVVLSFMFVIMGPALIGNPRYTFPIVYSTPIMLAYLISELGNRDSSESA